MGNSLILGALEEALFYFIHQIQKRGSSVVSTLPSGARGPGFDPRRRRGKFGDPNTLLFVAFTGMT